MNPRAAFIAFLLLTSVFSAARADELLLRNGDRLTGDITYDGSKLSIENKVTGKVSVDLKDVKTFSTTNPIEVVLKDGRKIHGKVSAGPDGQITITPESGLIQTLPLTGFKAINPPAEKWTGSVVVGGLLARGNTDSDSLNASADFGLRREHDRFLFSGQYIYSRQAVPGDGKHETADDLLGKAEYDYFITEKLYGYANVEAEHDVIAGLSVRLAPSVGVGYQWIETPRLSFNTEAGAGYLYRKYSHDGEDGTPDARLAYHLKAKLNDKVSVFHNFQYLPGFDSINNYFFSTDAGIRADLTAKFFTEFKIDYRYDSKPSPGRGPNDLRFILGIGYAL